MRREQRRKFASKFLRGWHWTHVTSGDAVSSYHRKQLTEMDHDGKTRVSMSAGAASMMWKSNMNILRTTVWACRKLFDRACRPERIATSAASIETVRNILDAARWSPSGGNMQPWQVIAVAGQARDEVIELAHRTLAANPAGEEGDYPVQPDELHGVLRERRRVVGRQRYAVMVIERDDEAGRAAAVARNYDFWGAPVGLFFITYRGLVHSQWAHLGMFIQSVVLAAAEKGLGSCVRKPGPRFARAWAVILACRRGIDLLRSGAGVRLQVAADQRLAFGAGAGDKLCDDDRF